MNNNIVPQTVSFLGRRKKGKICASEFMSIVDGGEGGKTFTNRNISLRK
jgi:hypothetical protein